VVGGLPSQPCNEDPVGIPLPHPTPNQKKKTLLSQIVLTANHSVRDVISCQHLLGSLKTLDEKISSPYPSSHIQTWSKAVLQAPLVFSVRTCAVIGHWKRQQRHTSQFGVLVDRSSENLSNSRTERYVPPIIIELHSAVMASKIAAKTPSSVDSSSYMCVAFHAPKHSLPDTPQWNNSSCRSLSALHNIQPVM